MEILEDENKNLEDSVKVLEGKLNTNITNSGIPSSKEIFKKEKKITDYEIKDIQCYSCGFLNKAIIPE